MDNNSIKEMFNSKDVPIIDFDLHDLSSKAQKLTGKLSISGVQPKLSIKYDKQSNLLIPVAEGGEYILKPQNPSFSNIPENEQCCMDIAKIFDINVPAHCLLPLKDKSLAYIVKRFDRESGKKIHQEDFAQILGADDKYNSSIERVGKRLLEISTAPGYDAQLFFDMVVCNFLIGNGDAHLKNFSIAYRNKEDIRLTPAYDIVCSKLAIKDEEDSALAINGRKNKLRRKDFDKLADYLNIPAKVRYEVFIGKLPLVEKMTRESHFNKEDQDEFISITRDRFSRVKL